MNRLFHSRSLWPRVILALLLVASGFLHFTDIGKFGGPIFDEVYFVTLASHYANKLPVWDIHPPLGKILYAVPLVLETTWLPSVSFLTYGYDHLAHRMEADYDFHPYGTFPYVPLRAVSAIFGLLLVVAIYSFTSALAGNEWAGALAAFFVAFDNAFLVETRAILLNGMYLSLGFLALALLVKRHSRPVLGGILLGLSLSVKLIGIVFVGPLISLIVLHDITKRQPFVSRRNIGRFLVTGGIVFATLLFALNNVTLPVDGRLLLYRELSDLPATTTGPGTIATMSPLLKTAGASLIELGTSISGYLGTNGTAGQSEWYTWPFLKNPPFYAASEKGGFIFLDGNPIVWALAAASVAFFLLSLRTLRASANHGIPALMLVSWVAFSLLPFAAFVSRPAYLYHYFPAFLFLLSLMSVLTVERLLHEPVATRVVAGIAITALVIAGFVAVLPFTYGFPV